LASMKLTFRAAVTAVIRPETPRLIALIKVRARYQYLLKPYFLMISLMSEMIFFARLSAVDMERLSL